jgi:hypothetical protein
MAGSQALWLFGVSGALAAGALACSDDNTVPPLGGPTGTGGGAAGMGGSASAGMGGAGASGGGGNGSGGGAAGHLPYAVCDEPPATYPAGPYGDEMGDTLAPLALQGWVNADGSDLANTAPFVPFTTEDLRQAGSPHVLLHLAATW